MCDTFHSTFGIPWDLKATPQEVIPWGVCQSTSAKVHSWTCRKVAIVGEDIIIVPEQTTSPYPVLQWAYQMGLVERKLWQTRVEVDKFDFASVKAERG